MDLHKIKALIDLLAESPLATLEVIEGEERVKLVKAKRRTQRGAAQNVELPADTAPVAGSTADAGAGSAIAIEQSPGSHDGAQTIYAPMFGVVHLTPSPGEAPFVQIGDAIEEGQVLCTIEAMKMFNAIESECRGTLHEILVTPGSEVESGQALFRIG
jgi:acetyl-CoA carboxylase biotin carboxyl carrier protein